MTLLEVLTLLNRMFYILLGVLTLVDYLRYRDRTRLDIALFFGSLGINVTVQLIGTTLERNSSAWQLASNLSAVLTMAIPYLVLRLVQHFRPVPDYLRAVGLVGTILSAVVLLALPNAESRPSVVILPLVIYFVWLTGYAAVAFVQDAFRTSGVTQRRLRFAALGTGLIATVIGFAGVTAVFPEAQSVLRYLTSPLAVTSGLSYYLAFATPRFLRQNWQMNELWRFMTDYGNRISTERVTESLDKLTDYTVRGVGGKGAVILLWDEREQSFAIQESAQTPELTGNIPLENARLVGEVWRSREASFVHLTPDIYARMSEGSRRLADHFKATGVYIVPIGTPRQQLGLLLVFLQRRSLFLEDDINLLKLFAEQSAITIIYELTERKQAQIEKAILERNLQHERERLKTIIAKVPGVVWEAWGDPAEQKQRIDFVSAYAEPLLGYPLADWLTTPGFDLTITHPEDRAQATKDLMTIFQDGSGMYQSRWLTADGRTLWMESHTSVIKDEKTGEPVGLRGVTMDITQRKQTEEVLRESEERFRMMADTAPVLIWMTGIDRKCLYLNRVWSQFTGRPLEDELGFGWVAAIHPDDQEMVVNAYNRAFEAREGFKVEMRLRYHDGSYRWVVNQGLPRFIGDGTFMGFIGSCFDITDRREAEEELKNFTAKLEVSNRELQDFAYVASHDLQEPLRKVQAFGDRLKLKFRDTLDEEGLDYLQRMQSAAGRMQRLIQDLLMFSRVTSQARPFRPVDLNKIVQDVMTDLEVRIEETGACFEIGNLATLDADEVQMNMLLQNLISNSLKYRREGVAPVIKVHGEVMLQLRSPNKTEVDPPGMYQLTVEDNGIGFDEKYLDKIFGLFQRLHGRTEYEGTGMGLAICRRIVERHGGTITARSIPDQGASFIVTLPLKHMSREKMYDSDGKVHSYSHGG